MGAGRIFDQDAPLGLDLAEHAGRVMTDDVRELAGCRDEPMVQVVKIGFPVALPPAAAAMERGMCRRLVLVQPGVQERDQVHGATVPRKGDDRRTGKEGGLMGYCSECGAWLVIDRPTALCAPCWGAWPRRGTGRSPADNPPPPEGTR
jgi:hypothetical protein